MFYPLERLTETSWKVKCASCGKQVAILPSDEMRSFLIWLTQTGQTVYCFDCDEVRSDEIHPLTEIIARALLNTRPPVEMVDVPRSLLV